MRSWKIVVVVSILVFGGMQCIRPKIAFGPHTAEISAPPEVRQVLEKDCYSCHSSENKLAWFDQVQPAYWLVRHHILEARQHLNFSTLGNTPAAAQKAALYESVATMQMGTMPLTQFTQLHPEARVTDSDLATLKAYLDPWSTPLPKTSDSDSLRPNGMRTNLAAVRPTANGQSFDPTMEGWHLISTTDRGDNMQFRLILGNDIAVHAAQVGDMHPWPDGSRLAKFAWLQTQGDDGLVYPGKFWQVELMEKNSGLHKSTGGWVWGRWRGIELKPYGAHASVVRECTGCHMPVQGNDNLYTEPITQAQVAGSEIVNNNAAKLPAELPYQPLSWGVISMYLDPQKHTSSVLFGNKVALEAAKSTDAQTVSYPAGSVLALVTWTQRDDPHWFGARIPDLPVSVEFLETSTRGLVEQYRKFGGPNLGEVHTDAIESVARLHFIARLRPLLFP